MRLIAATGDRAHQYAVCNASLPKGSTQADVYDAVVASMKPYGVSSPKKPDFMEGRLLRGKVIFKMAADAMQGVADTNAFEWGYGTEGVTSDPQGHDVQENRGRCGSNCQYGAYWSSDRHR